MKRNLLVKEININKKTNNSEINNNIQIEGKISIIMKKILSIDKT